MPKRFCAICGDNLNDSSPSFNMCLKCFLKEHPLFELPKNLSFKMCSDCGKYAKKEQWYESGNDDLFFIIKEAITKFILKPVSKKGDVSFSILFNEDSYIYSNSGLIKSLNATIKGTLNSDSTITHQEELKIDINYQLCKNCSNIRGGFYFLSILQLRVNSETQFNLIQEVIENIYRYVENLFQKDDRHYISKIEDAEYGVDLYLSTNELMNYIIRFLRTNHHFILKRSKKLTGRDIQGGKNIYRLKSLIKFLPIKKDDIIIINNQSYRVETISKKNVFLRDDKGTKLIKNYKFFFEDKLSFKVEPEDF